ncbi:MAG: AP2/ERF family transcription factor [Sedimentisphaerales bacterium]|jgi:hypothetical protein
MKISKAKELNWLGRILHTVYLVYYRSRFGHEIRLIPLTRYKFAIVDADDYERLKDYHWSVRYSCRTWYAVRCARVSDRTKKRLVWMHNAIMGNPKGKLIDHFNHNGLDNRRANLRAATRGQNTVNCRKRKGCSSRFKGVCFHKNSRRYKPWDSYINVNGRRISLGCFATEVEAARAYDAVARKYHGEFARVNFPEENSLSATR